MVFSDVESFLDTHPELFEDYLNRKGKQSMVEKWLKNHQPSSKAPTAAVSSPSTAAAAAAAEPVEKTCVKQDSWASVGRSGDGLQRRVSQKELRKTFARWVRHVHTFNQ